MSNYPHLKLPLTIGGIIKPPKGRPIKNEDLRTQFNKGVGRKKHGEHLLNSAITVVEKWDELHSSLREKGIEIPNTNDIPVFLKIDTNVFNIDSLSNWGIEVISEEEQGYIIGSSLDKLQTFQEKVNQFIGQNGKYKNTAAKIWELETGDNWRIENLLKGELFEIWENINTEEIYNIELGVSCQITNKKEFPNADNYKSEHIYNQKVEEYNAHLDLLQLERDKKQIIRETEIEKYIKDYNGQLHDIWDNSTDAVYFKISINGQGLKDLVFTYQYLFEVKLDTKFSIEHEHFPLLEEIEIEIIAPDENAPKVCVIDSGIQENHRLLEPSIDHKYSKSYVDDDDSTADYVKQSGHGTKVAGAILYPDSIPKKGVIKLDSIIQNARILDRKNEIPSNRFEPSLMENIINDYPETRIFNLSVADKAPFLGTHMPALAASIDKLIHEKNVLFIVAAGNVPTRSDSVANLGIVEQIQSGKDYPNYLDENDSKIANPGVSHFAITVGSIAKEDFENEDYKAMAGKNYISPFSRTGLGMWGCIKPDVVEFGGDLIKNKLSLELTTKEETLPELVNSTMYGASAVSQDSFGTSFSTPKVSYIASKLQSEHPLETAQMYRALIIQSARLPEHCFYNPTLNDFKYYGYGVPDVNRALNNTKSRITFIQDGKVNPKKADIYRLKIPNSLKGEGKDFRILVEVTLAYTAKTRVTRKGTHNYLSNWLDWKSSKYNESFHSFRKRTLDYINEEFAADDIDEAGDAIKWVVRENSAWGVKGISRNNSTVQKSWTIIEPYQFSDEFNIAVVGHFGWDKNPENLTPYALCVSFEVLDAELNIYEILSQAQVEIEQEINY